MNIWHTQHLPSFSTSQLYHAYATCDVKKTNNSNACSSTSILCCFLDTLQAICESFPSCFLASNTLAKTCTLSVNHAEPRAHAIAPRSKSSIEYHKNQTKSRTQTTTVVELHGHPPVVFLTLCTQPVRIFQLFLCYNTYSLSATCRGTEHTVRQGRSFPLTSQKTQH